MTPEHQPKTKEALNNLKQPFHKLEVVHCNKENHSALKHLTPNMKCYLIIMCSSHLKSSISLINLKTRRNIEI